MPRLDERALRRDTFTDGPRIVLGDGQEWTLPKPVIDLDAPKRVDFRPTVGPDGQLVMDGGRLLFESSFGPEWDARVEAFQIAEPGLEETNLLLNLAWDLLQRNYALEAAEAYYLLPVRTNDEANAAMWEAIVDVILGRSPKPTASGSGAS